jgi:hypothetical protein
MLTPAVGLLLAPCAAAAPTFAVYGNVSACHELMGEGGKEAWGINGRELRYLGVTPSLASCNALAAVWHNSTAPNERCLSTCWWRAPGHPRGTNASFLPRHQCYCRAAPSWMPLPSAQADSAVVHWPCVGPESCSYNGRCGGDGQCECSAAWGGVRCGELQLLPVNRTAPGFREVGADGVNVSTWGAPVLFDEASGRWHGWTSEITHGCGINAWETNSQIVHIVGDGPTGPFTRREVFASAFAHEPDVVRGPKGEWVIVFSAFNAITRAEGLRGYTPATLAAAVCNNCTNSASPPPGTPGCPFQRGSPRNLSHPMIQMMAVASSPDGPWKMQELHGLTAGWDWNTALTINPDGSAVALIRGGMVWHATDYSDNTTWKAVGRNASGTLGPQGPQWSTSVEDPCKKSCRHLFVCAHCLCTGSSS